MKKIERLIVMMLCVCLLCTMAGMPSYAEENSVVRVAYATEDDTIAKDEAGNFSGYTYEYLMTIAQYAGIHYEFVPIEGNRDTARVTGLQMLKDGQVDLLGGVPYMEDVAKNYEYVANNYGMYGLALYVQASNNALNTSSLYSTDNIKVAVLCEEEPDEVKALETFVEAHNLSIQMLDAGTVEGQLEMLESGEADALLSDTLECPSDSLRSIRQFDTKPFYFITRQGNDELTQKLNEAIAESQENDPTYETLLNEKYFANTGRIIELTEEEKEYIKQLGAIQVLSLGGNAPISYHAENGENKGFSMEVLNYIAENTGLQLDITIIDDMEEYQKHVEAGEAGMIVCRSDMRTITRMSGYYASRKFFTIPMSLVVNAETDQEIEDADKEAVPFLTSETSEGAFVGSPEACLSAINEGVVDYGYVNVYAVDHYTNADNMNNVYVYPQSAEYSESLVIAVNEEISDKLLPIVNKMLHNLEEENLAEEYLYRNMVESSEVSLSTYVKNNTWEVLLLVAFMLTTLLVIMITYRYFLEKKSKEHILYQSRIEGLTGCLVRQAFFDEAEKIMEELEEGDPLLYFMIDVDDFKYINDTYGHRKGDWVLQEIAAILIATFFKDKCVGRMGGDEFAILVTNPEMIENIEEILNRVIHKVADIDIAEDAPPIALSIGGIKVLKGMDVSQLYEAADRVMYKVKRENGNAWKIDEL